MPEKSNNSSNSHHLSGINNSGTITFGNQTKVINYGTIALSLSLLAAGLYGFKSMMQNVAQPPPLVPKQPVPTIQQPASKKLAPNPASTSKPAPAIAPKNNALNLTIQEICLYLNNGNSNGQAPQATK